MPRQEGGWIGPQALLSGANASKETQHLQRLKQGWCGGECQILCAREGRAVERGARILEL